MKIESDPGKISICLREEQLLSVCVWVHWLGPPRFRTKPIKVICIPGSTPRTMAWGTLALHKDKDLALPARVRDVLSSSRQDARSWLDSKINSVCCVGHSEFWELYRREYNNTTTNSERARNRGRGGDRCLSAGPKTPLVEESGKLQQAQFQHQGRRGANTHA